MKKIFMSFIVFIFILGIFIIPGFSSPTPIVLTSADGKATLTITDWDLDHDITVSISNPVFSEHSGFFKITVYSGEYGTIHPHATTGGYFNFSGKLTASIDDAKMSANGGVVQGQACIYKSADPDGQWTFGWASIVSNKASVALNGGGIIYGLPNVIVIGSALPNDDRIKGLMGTYSNDGKFYLGIKTNGPDIGDRDAFQFIEPENPIFGTYQGKRGGSSLDMDIMDETGNYHTLTSGMIVQGWILDSSLAASVASFEIDYYGYSYHATTQCSGISTIYDWSYTDSPYHTIGIYGLNGTHIGYLVPACL